MGTIKQGILGAFSGSVGSVVGGSWKGIATMKSKPASVANPQTAGQVEQRSRMSGVMVFAKNLLSNWIKPLWDKFAVRSSGINQFVSKNIANFIEGVLVTPADLVMSIGNMVATSIDTAVATEGSSTIEVSWTADTDGFHLASDIAYVCVYNETQDLFSFSSIQTRDNENITISQGPVFAELDVVHCWLVFRRANGLYVSLASYSLGTVTPT